MISATHTERDRRARRGRAAPAVMLALAAGGSTGWAASAPAAQTWSRPQTLDAPVGQMQAAAGPGNRFAALWQGDRLKVAWGSATRAFGRPVGRRIDGTAGLALTGPGTALVAWDDALSPLSSLSVMRVATVTARGFGPARVVSPRAQRMQAGVPLIGPSGQTLIPWSQETGYRGPGGLVSDGGIVVVIGQPDGSFRPPVAVTDVPAFEHAAAIDAAGEALVAWNTPGG